jgi:hypothetical protein
MRKAVLAAVSVILCSAMITPLGAQSIASSPQQSISKCSSGLRGGGPDCAQDRRLLIVVTMNGSEPSPELFGIIGLGSSTGGAFALTTSNATAADSAVYAVMSMTRDVEGNYRIDRRVAGSKVRSPENCRGSSTGSADDMGFGAFLALETQKLVRCVQHTRGARTP